MLKQQRAAFLEAGPPSLEQRLEDLDRLRRVLLENQENFAAAISKDFGHRSRHETLISEIFVSLEGIKHMRRNLAEWMSPERRWVSMLFFPGRSQVVYQPVGVVGVIAPWNFPVQLALLPVATALAAGNRVMLKPSEFTPATSALLKEALGRAFPDDKVAVVLGGPEVGAAFSRLAFDHLLFTGSTSVGRKIMQAAAENLVPVTLELGGKSPFIVDESFSMERAAGSLVTGKLTNAGQICIAPDYALVPEGRSDELVASLQREVGRRYPTMLNNPDYTSIVNHRHYERLRHLLSDAEAKGGRLVEVNPGGERFDDASKHKLPLTLVLNPTEDMAVMQDEIFGPILPVVSYRTLDEAIGYVNARPRPLALYLFSDDEQRQQRVLERTTSGGVCINETLLHVAQEDLPFGGIGASGMGAYHGREGFLAMSHKKPVFHQARWNGTALMKPPYGPRLERLLKFMLR
ncbi:MAG: coniferyl aldehyde dehydrogenase [Polyangia bacterium]